MITRRNTLSKLRTGLLLMIASVCGTCIQVWGAMSRWSWHGYPDEKALRDHLNYSDNHPHIKPDHVKLMTFKQCIAFHEWDHHIRRKNRGRWSTARQVPGTTDGEAYEAPVGDKYELPLLPGETEPQIVTEDGASTDSVVDTSFSFDGLTDPR